MERADRPARETSNAGVAGATLQEEELVKRLRSGEKNACELVVARHGARMMALARGLLREPGAAEAAVLEAFRRAFQSIDRLPPGESLASWLRRIQIEACVANLRSTADEEPIEPFLPTFLPDGHQARPAAPWRPLPDSAGERKKVLLHVQELFEGASREPPRRCSSFETSRG